jgi:L-fuculose-phosphate aldolase
MVIMKNHGIAAAGASIEEAVVTTLMLDEAARIQLLAEAVGQTAPEFPPEAVLALREKISRPDQFEINFNYLVRKTKRRQG